jgi:predicted DsbA family dithiol-disulfide isomerase
MKVEIYSDVVCPWCYVGKARFERALAAFPKAEDVEVVYRPFRLDPEAPERPRPHRQVLNEKFGERSVAMDARVARLGNAEGLTFDFDSAVENNTLLAHRLLRLALDEYGSEAQARLKGRLMADHFAGGKDVGDRAYLVEAAVSAGLDADRVTAILTTDELRDEVLAELEEAGRLGINAVPTFVFDGQWAIQGGQETSVFLRALEEISQLTAQAEEKAAEAGAAAGAAEADDADGCADGVCEVH